MTVKSLRKTDERSCSFQFDYMESLYIKTGFKNGDAY